MVGFVPQPTLQNCYRSVVMLRDIEELDTAETARRLTVQLSNAAFPPSDEPVPAEVPESLVEAILAARSAGHPQT